MAVLPFAALAVLLASASAQPSTSPLQSGCNNRYCCSRADLNKIEINVKSECYVNNVVNATVGGRLNRVAPTWGRPRDGPPNSTVLILTGVGLSLAKANDMRLCISLSKNRRGEGCTTLEQLCVPPEGMPNGSCAIALFDKKHDCCPISVARLPSPPPPKRLPSPKSPPPPKRTVMAAVADAGLFFSRDFMLEDCQPNLIKICGGLPAEADGTATRITDMQGLVDEALPLWREIFTGPNCRPELSDYTVVAITGGNGTDVTDLPEGCGIGATSLSCLQGVQNIIDAISNPPIIGGFLETVQRLPAKAAAGTPAGNMFDTLRMSSLLGNSFLQELRIPIYTGEEIASYESGNDDIDAACANIADNVMEAESYVLGYASVGWEKPEVEGEEEEDESKKEQSKKESSWLETTKISVCAAVNPCQNTFIIGLEGFTSPPIETEFGEFTLALTKVGFSYGSNFDTSYMVMPVSNAWLYSWSDASNPSFFATVNKRVNILMGGRVTWSLDVESSSSKKAVANIEMSMDAALGINTAGSTKEVILTAEAAGPTITLEDQLEIDLSSLMSLSSSIQWRYKSASDWSFEYVLAATLTNDVSKILQSGNSFGDILGPIVRFTGGASLAVRIDDNGVAVRIEVDGRLELAKDLRSILNLPALHADGIIFLYYMVGPVCWQNCPSGFTDTGALCLKPSPYGRGSGYPWKFGDGMNLHGARRRCERSNSQGCEQAGALYYDQEALLCYDKCRSGFKGVGPLCWATGC
ncbi:hypothetical protein HYH03_008774 [Edaphochlamys debaryana]|uniref:Pherophorin domain-containing protein n=1 Tax=Edaphochlamys debaryana TaxID=47281 RepID=A0A835XZJ1_9CHLO|nr:hypothetical protein HYH03_008774 [Edaphochlamys debaryana]|eukprot:KAG2493111.1 hypothetical protein HYH03_008774 [Edaphochlamys debaryana]